MLTEMELAYGNDWITQNGICVKHPTLRDLRQYDDAQVYAFIRMFCLQPQDIYIDLWENGIDFEKMVDYDLFLLLYLNNKVKHDEMFKIFMGMYRCEYFESVNEKEEIEKFIIGYNSEGSPFALIDQPTYSELTVFFKSITCFENAKRPRFANQKMKEMILDMEIENKIDNKEDGITMVQQMNALVWGNTCGYNWNNIWDLNFYQFNYGLRHLDKIKHTQALWGGYYAGTINVKQVPKKELDWKAL